MIETTKTHYIIDNKKFVRVTEALSVMNRPLLNKWQADVGTAYAEDWSARCSEIGVQVHAIIADIINGKSFNDTPGHKMEWQMLSPEIKHGVMAWWQAKLTIPFKPVQSELLLVSEKYGYAGTTDCLAKIGKSKYLLDWKVASKLWDEVKFQLSAYFTAYKEMTGRTLSGARAIRLDRDTGRWTKKDQIVMDSDELTETFEKGFLPLLSVYKILHQEVK